MLTIATATQRNATTYLLNKCQISHRNTIEWGVVESEEKKNTFGSMYFLSSIRTVFTTVIAICKKLGNKKQCIHTSKNVNWTETEMRNQICTEELLQYDSMEKLDGKGICFAITLSTRDFTIVWRWTPEIRHKFPLRFQCNPGRVFCRLFGWIQIYWFFFHSWCIFCTWLWPTHKQRSEYERYWMDGAFNQLPRECLSEEFDCIVDEPTANNNAWSSTFKR